MTRRTRSFIIDNSLTRVWNNTRSVSESNASNLLLGSKPLSKTLSQKTTQNVVVTNNLGGLPNGVKPDGLNGGVVSSLTLRLFKASTGSSVIVRLRIGSSYATSTVINSYTIPVNSASAVTFNTPGVSYTTGDSFFFDVTQVGSRIPGTGLSIIINYYAG